MRKKYIFKKRKTFFRGAKKDSPYFSFKQHRYQKQKKAEKALRSLQELFSGKFPSWTEEEVIKEVKEIRKTLKEKNFSKKD